MVVFSDPLGEKAAAERRRFPSVTLDNWQLRSEVGI
jgi:hypothetical protein